MRIVKALVVAGMIVYQSGVIFACEEYKSYSSKEMKEYRDMLGKSDADPLDRLFAFDKLACSDNPNLRNYAVKEGFNKSIEPLVRNQVMLKAMMQKKRIDIEMNSKKESTNDDKKFIAKHSGVYSMIVYYRSEKEGCISVYLRDRCDTATSLFIKGDKLEYNYSKVFGEFQLSQSGELVGYLRADNTSKYSRIPAVIKLF